MPENWFRAEMQFVCPSCRKVSKEMILARARSKEAVAIAIVERVTLECQLCKEVCLVPVDIQLSINEMTPREIANVRLGSSASTQLGV